MGPEDLVSALALIARADADTLRNEANKLNETTTTTTTSKSNQVEQNTGNNRSKSIQHALEQEQKAHIQRYIDTIKCENQSRELEAQIKNHFEVE